MKPLAKTLILVPAAISLLLAVPAVAQAAEPAKQATAPLDLSGDSEDIHLGDKEYSPYLDQGYPTRPYWGDTHVHTSYSTDAGMFGNRLGPDKAYRFARGEEVVSSTGVRAKLVRPLDWLVIADHAENLGLAPMIAESNPDLLRNAWGKMVHDLTKGGKSDEAYAAWGEKMGVRDNPLPGDCLLYTSDAADDLLQV